MDVSIIINNEIGILGVFDPDVSEEDVIFYAEYWKEHLQLKDYDIVDWVVHDQNKFNTWKQNI